MGDKDVKSQCENYQMETGIEKRRVSGIDIDGIRYC